MINIFLKVLPLALGGAVNPLGILIVLLMLSRPDKPLKRAWLFLTGFAFALIFLLLIAHPIIKYTYGMSLHQNIYSAIFDIVIGILLILFAIFSKRKHKTEINTASNPWRNLIAGFLFMIVIDLDTLLFYIAAIKIIFDAKLGFANDVVIFIITIVIIMSTMALPALLATLIPNKSAKFLEALNQFVDRRGQLIGKIVVVLIAIYLIYNGTRFFV